MHIHRGLVGLALLALAACTQFEISAQAGYTELAVGGEIGLESSGSPVVDQNLDSALGLGGDSGSPYARLQLDMGVPQLSVSGFSFDQQGRGTLVANFGNVLAGQQVDSELSLANLKAAYAFEIGMGPVSVAPGLAVDWFDLDMRVNAIGASEQIQVTGPVPLLFLRGDVDLGVVGVVGEAGYLTLPEVDEVEASLWDLELMVEVRPTDMLHLFVGYRSILLEGRGTSDDEDYDLDLDISGFMIGGGIRF